MAPTLNTACRSSSRADILARAALRAAGQLVFASLVAFHAWLLWMHVAAGEVFEPQTAARWVVALIVAAGFRTLGRLGLPLFRGRRAVVLWLLVVLIHAHGIWTGDSVSIELGIPETVVLLVQATATAAVLGIVLGTVSAAERVRRGGRLAFAPPLLIGGLPSTGIILPFASRPPPLA